MLHFRGLKMFFLTPDSPGYSLLLFLTVRASLCVRFIFAHGIEQGSGAVFPSHFVTQFFPRY